MHLDEQYLAFTNIDSPNVETHPYQLFNFACLLGMPSLAHSCRGVWVHLTLTDMQTLSWTVHRHRRPIFDGTYVMSDHAISRMCERSLAPDDVEAVLTYGQPVYDRGALVFRLGRKQVDRFAPREQLDHLEGVHVVCTPDDGTVMTVYRNRDFRTPRKTRRSRRDRQSVRR